MPINRNLERGQYQLGDLIMGPYTPFKVESIDIGNYDMNAQDTQKQMSSEIDFGQDTLKPAPLSNDDQRYGQSCVAKHCRTD
jgi:hypothetical protein